jgi:hypothetical protein
MLLIVGLARIDVRIRGYFSKPKEIRDQMIVGKAGLHVFSKRGCKIEGVKSDKLLSHSEQKKEFATSS